MDGEVVGRYLCALCKTGHTYNANFTLYDKTIYIYIYRQLWKTRTDNFERKEKKKIYIYTVKNLKKFKNLIKIDVSVRDLHQLQCK